MKSHKNILALTYWSYKDGLIQAYTLPYLYIISRQLAAGSAIYLVTVEQMNMAMSDKEKTEAKEHLKKYNIRWIALSYKKFPLSVFYWSVAVIFLLSLIFIKKIKTIHAWCMTAGAIGYFLSLLSGRKLVVDSYEPHAEAMVENGTWKRRGLKFISLFYLEMKLSHHADVLIGVTEKMKEYAKEKYGVVPKRFFVKPACVDVSLFSRKEKNIQLATELDIVDKIVCLYVGKFGGIYLKKEVFDFFKIAEDFWGDKFRVLLLTPQSEKELKQEANTSGFDSNKMVIRFVPHSQIADYFALADFAITPVKPVPTKRYCTPIKDGEYWAAGLPVVITRNISDDSEIIERNEIGAIINELTVEDYKRVIEKIEQLLNTESPELHSKKITGVAEKYRSFGIAEKVYEQIYGNG